MAIKQYDAFAGYHDFKCGLLVKVAHEDRETVAERNLRQGYPRGHHQAWRTGWYWKSQPVPGGAGTLEIGGPFTSSRKAYQAARAKFHDTDKGS